MLRLCIYQRFALCRTILLAEDNTIVFMRVTPKVKYVYLHLDVFVHSPDLVYSL